MTDIIDYCAMNTPHWRAVVPVYQPANQNVPHDIRAAQCIDNPGLIVEQVLFDCGPCMQAYAGIMSDLRTMQKGNDPA